MEFRETLLRAQKNQQQQSSKSSYYKARFDPPKKEQKQKDRLSANIQKFLAKKDEEEKQKKLDAQRKKDELLAMRDPKALRKIQKTLKVIKSANKSVLADAIDRDNTAVTRDGPDQPDQDDYGYESQEAAAIYEKMMQKYSKIPDEPKFPVGQSSVKKDLKGTMERVKHALQHEDDPVPHKRRRKGGTGDRESSPPTKYEPEKEKRKDEQTKADKPKFRKPAPPPMDFNQLLKLAEQKKSQPIDVAGKKAVVEQETERPMTKKQRREYEEEMARRQRRQERLDAEKGGKKVNIEERPEKEKKPEPGFGRIPKVGERNTNHSRNDSPKIDKVRPASDRDRPTSDRDRPTSDRDRLQREIEKAKIDKERAERERDRLEKDKAVREERLAKERLDKLKAEREKIERDIERLNRDREKLDKTKSRLENGIQSEKSNKSSVADRSKLNSKTGSQDVKKNIDLKSQNTYRIDKNSNDRKFTIPSKNSNGKCLNGDRPVSQSSKGNVPQKNGVKDKELLAKQALKTNGRIENKKPEVNKGAPTRRPEDRPAQGKLQAGPSKPKMSNSFDFEKHINSIGAKNTGKPNGARQFPPGDVRRKANGDDRKKPKRRLDSDSEYDSEMDDFIDDGDENLDYSHHIKEIFGYDKSKYRDMDDDDDPEMESSFARQQREEYISKKIGIMEDLEDMRMEAMEKKKAKKKGRRISDDD